MGNSQQGKERLPNQNQRNIPRMPDVGKGIGDLLGGLDDLLRGPGYGQP